MNPKLPSRLIAFGNVILDETILLSDNVINSEQYKMNELGECSPETLDELLATVSNGSQINKTELHAGGSALNTCRILCSLGEERQLFFGSIGTDANGALIKDILKSEGLAYHLQSIDGKPTGRCVCIIRGSERSCYAHIGASVGITLEYIEQYLPNILIVESQIYYIEGFFLTNNRLQICQSIVNHVQSSSNKILAVNLSASYIVTENQPEILYLLKHSEIIFGNFDEYMTLAPVFNSTTIDELIDAFFLSLHKSATKIFIITDGANPIKIYKRNLDGSLHCEHVKANRIDGTKIVDTTGAGDAFVAGFFYGFLRLWSTIDCVKKGVTTATKKLKSVGGNLSKVIS